MYKIKLLIVLLVSIAPSLLFAQSSIQDDYKSFMNGEKIKYSTDGHPKSQGFDIQIEYPKTWMKKEGERPHIVQKFSSSEDGGRAKVATLNITPLSSDLEKFSDKDIAEKLFNPELAESMLPEGSKLIIAKPTEYDGEPGILLYYITQMSRAGANFVNMVVSHRFLYQRNTVDFTIAYSILLTSSQKKTTQQQGEALLGLSIQMGNSIILLDKYKNKAVAEEAENWETTMNEYITMVTNLTCVEKRSPEFKKCNIPKERCKRFATLVAKSCIGEEIASRNPVKHPRDMTQEKLLNAIEQASICSGRAAQLISYYVCPEQYE